jgi:hypothetical protein
VLARWDPFYQVHFRFDRSRIVCNVPFIVCVAFCAVFCLNVVVILCPICICVLSYCSTTIMGK